ncbi:MAG: potassium channel family protein [Candidatus Hydrogenedentes bacterium]|nr:potassium channel family protein [Candidatus Hydrogenedentota bacterium]
MRAKLHTPATPPAFRHVVGRVGILLMIVLVSVVFLFVEGGLVDSKTGEKPTFLDTLYFTMVTITTVGYGDIVPDSSIARMTDTFFLAPMRLIVFVLFVGIAYELTFKRFQESFRMSRAVQNLKNHIVVCGFGETGQVAVQELLASGRAPEQIVVLEIDESVLDHAAELQVVAMLGDATKEQVLRSVAIERASHILICPGRDDTTVLIALTAHDLSPGAKLAARCHHAENVHLIERSGVDTIVPPSAGNLIAAATRRPHLVDTMKDLLRIGGSAYLDERRVTGDEIDKHPSELKDMAVVRVYRDGTHFDIGKLPTLQDKDIIVYVASVEKS